MTRVLIAYDHDAAGDEAAEKLAAELMGQRHRVLPGAASPADSDANDVAVRRPNRSTPSVAGAGGRVDGNGQGTRRQAAPAGQGDGEPPEGDVVVGRVTSGSVKVHGRRGRVGPEVTPANPFFSAAVLPAAVFRPEPLRSGGAHDELVLEIGPRRWRVRHIPKAAVAGRLRVNVMVGAGERFHVDTVDLYSAKASGRASPRRPPPSCELSASSSSAELGRVLLATEDAQAAAVSRAGIRRGARHGGSRAGATPWRCSSCARPHGPGGGGVRHPRGGGRADQSRWPPGSPSPAVSRTGRSGR